MRSARSLLFAAGLLFAACAPEEDGGYDYDANVGPAMPSVVDSGVPNPTGGPGGTTAGTVMGGTTAGTTMGGTTVGTVIGGSPGGSPSGSTTAGTMIQPDAGANEAGAPPPVPMVSGDGPKLPTASMACPDFKSGMMTIMGLSVEVYAGPKGTSGKAPLLFYWHGTGGNGMEAMRSLPASVHKEIMDQGGLIIAPTTTTMKGTDVTFFLSVWYTDGDFAFADLVADCAVKNYGVDARRIYSTGCSAGGLMTGAMAFQRSNYLAAAAPNSGGFAYPGLDVLQDPKRVTPTMTMHGKLGSDTFGGGVIDFSETSKSFADSALPKGGFVVNCDHGGGHCRTPPELQVAAWQFMKDHPFGVTPEPYANGLPSSFPSYCKILSK